jgi:hypothetical protein
MSLSGMLMRFRRVLRRRFVIALFVMLRRRVMGFRGVLVVLGCLLVRVFCHEISFDPLLLICLTAALKAEQSEGHPPVRAFVEVD